MSQSYGGLNFDHRYATLPPLFYTRLPPEAVAEKPRLLAFNPAVAAKIGLDPNVAKRDDFAEIFSGNAPLPGGLPLAMVYAGHQFGVWAGQLGDGRAHLLGQCRNPDGELRDIQLKGSGLTPYSRMGDGRAVLRSSIREYLAGIALEGLGIPTTHALCLIATGSPVWRETREPGAVLTRVARSHIRFGHFEHFAYHGMADQLPILMNHMLENYLPEYTIQTCFDQIVRQTATLIGDWQAMGFAHGVMNTDNMSALGLTIDYGPYGFMEGFDLGLICNHSDTGGRYRFDRQPEIGYWNLHALGHALQSLIPVSVQKQALEAYFPCLIERYHLRMMTRLGLTPEAAKPGLWQAYLQHLQQSGADYSGSFFALADWLDNPELSPEFCTTAKAGDWLERYRQLAASSAPLPEVAARIRQVNPRYILRNWVAEDVIRAAEDHDDLAPLHRLAKALAQPCQAHPEAEPWTNPAPAHYRNLSVSCSS